MRIFVVDPDTSGINTDTGRVNVCLKTIEVERTKFFASSKKAKDLVDAIIDKLPPKYYNYVDLFLRRAAEELLPY